MLLLPLVFFQNLDFVPGDIGPDDEVVENNTIYCGGSSDGSEDGFECVLLFLEDTYIESAIDLDGDTFLLEWFERG